MSNVSRGVNIGPPRFKIAVHAVVWLAKSGGLLSSAMIASQVDSHATFMRRVLQSLTVSGIVASRGGREGGYLLRKPAGEITLGEIYESVGAGLCAEAAEADGGVCGEAGAQLDAALEGILKEAEQCTIAFLRGFTIADVMDQVVFD